MLTRSHHTSQTADDPQTSRIVADLSGAVINGQVAVGEHIVQIHAEQGAIVNYVEPPRRPVARPRPAPVRRLPRDARQLLGRENELSLAVAATSSGESVEFYGPPGIGKTALLRRLAHRLGDESANAVVFSWCGRQPVGDMQQFIFESLFACDSPIVPTPADLATYLGDQRALVLLDDVEPERVELDRLMDTLPVGVFVCAAQERRLWGEGRSLELTGLAEHDAVALIERELGRSLNDGERAAALQRVAVLRGHPLETLKSAAQFDAARSPAAQPLLEVLAALPGVPVPTDDLAAVTGIHDAARQLEAFEAQHLVQAHSPRYSLIGLPPLSTDAHATMSWRQRLLEHYVSDQAVPHADAERALRAAYVAPPILSLLAWAGQAGQQADVVALARSADPTLALGCRWGAWGEALDHALLAARSIGDQAGEAWALHQIGSRALCLQDVFAAKAALTSALEMRERLGDEQGAALTRHNLGLLDGGPPVGSSRNGGSGPSAPLMTLAILLVAIVLAIGATAAFLLPGDDPASAGSPVPVPATTQGETTPAGTPTSSTPSDTPEDTGPADSQAPDTPGPRTSTSEDEDVEQPPEDVPEDQPTVTEETLEPNSPCVVVNDKCITLNHSEQPAPGPK